MLGVGVGGSGYVRLLVNPMNIPGTGHIQFWIYPTGNMDAHVDIDFYLNTVIANVAPLTEQETIVYCNSSGQLTLKNGPPGTTNLYDMRGCLVQSWKTNSNLHTETLLEKNNQVYLIQTADGKTYRFFIP
jgi:hypothetical protein